MQSTSIKEVTSWLKNLELLAATRTCRPPAFLRPFHFVTLALSLKAQQAGGLELPRHLAGYAQRMRLWQSIGLRPPATIREFDASGKFVPIERLASRDAVDDCASRISAITGHAELDEISKRSLDISVSEVIDNCFSHAGVVGDLHGLACAQFWQRGHLAQIAVADMGMGIRKTFEVADTPDFRERVKVENSCSLATELYASSKLNGDHAGYGLALTRQLIERNGGTIVVFSGNEWCLGKGSTWSSGMADVDWRGTLVIVEFNTNIPLRTSDVYASWDQPVRGYSHDDFDFPL